METPPRERGEWNDTLTLHFETRDFARGYRNRAHPTPPAEQLRWDLNYITEHVDGVNRRTEAIGYAVRHVADAVDPNTETTI